MNQSKQFAVIFIKITVGSALFGLGFNLFLLPNGLNAGGISGLAMGLQYLTGFGTVGSYVLLLNLPLFALAGVKIGKKFILGSAIGMIISSTLIDVMAIVPKLHTEPLIAALYGGALCGLGLGIVFGTGYTTGGSDIIVRLLKRKWQNVPIGTIHICFDFAVVVFTGIVFGDISRSLYSSIAIFVTGRVIDSVVYSFDYSKVAMIISKDYEQLAQQISTSLSRGVTYLRAEGFFSGAETKVVMTAVKRQQLSQLKALVAELDPNAFIIVQDAHQVLGDGFLHNSTDSL